MNQILLRMYFIQLNQNLKLNNNLVEMIGWHQIQMKCLNHLMILFKMINQKIGI